MDIQRAMRFAKIILGKHTLTAAVVIHASIMPPSAWAHVKLIVTEPKAGAVVSVTPATLRLQFNDHVELPFTKIRLVDAREAHFEALAVKPDPANPKALLATIPPLPPGAYRVLWSTVSRDGHKVKGEYSFTVK